uniref:Putative glycosyltransferase EcbJ n=1 Tax=Pasteurella multocida TaxID=747 RepID=Q9AHM5_PASMD|nr:putative glycosyltransferase EcbJ [Pasteurella multocida]
MDSNDKLIKLIEEKLIKELTEFNQTRDKLKGELNEQEKEIENIKQQLEIIDLLENKSFLPREGDTISYKLGKILLETNLFNFYRLPKRLWALNRYAKYRKSIIKQENNNSISHIIEKCENKKNPAEIRKENKNEELINTGLTEKIITILSITNNQRLYMYNKIAPTYHLIENNIWQLNNTKANIFIIDSVWSGINNNWEYALLSDGINSIQSRKLKDVIDTIKAKSIPIVFVYNEKEIHYNKFKSIMAFSDIILTSNISALDKVSVDFKDKKSCYLQKSLYLEYCNPHNPLNFFEKNNVIYLGEYDKNFNDDDLDLLEPFLSLPNNELTLIHSDISHNKLYDKYPGRWDIIPSNMEFTEVINKLKSFKFSLFISDTEERDIPQKIIDSLVSGVPVISTRNTYLEEKFKDIILFIDSPTQLHEIVEKYENDRWAHARLAHKGYRFVMNNFSTHSLKANLQREICGKAINSDNNPLISIIMASMREFYIDRIITNISRQTYKNKELIIVTQNFSEIGLKKLQEKLEKIDDLVNFKIIVNNSEDTLGERQNQAASYANGSLLAKFDDDDFYFDNYLADMALPFQFGDYDMVGKAEVFFYLEALDKTVLVRDGRAAYREMDFVSGATFVIKKSTFNKLGGFIEVNQSEDSNFIKRLKESGGKIYSSDPFNFVVFRSKDVSNHTWQQKAEAFANPSLHVGNGIPEEITVI